MESNAFFNSINLDDNSAMPKYIQLANSIANAIIRHNLQQDELLPSINELNFNLDISRGTAEKSYRYLLNNNILRSVPGKGFYPKGLPGQSKKKILVLLDKLSAENNSIFQGFFDIIGEKFHTDIHVYNHAATLLNGLLPSDKDYALYVVMSGLQHPDQQMNIWASQLPKNKLIFLGDSLNGTDTNKRGSTESPGSIYLNLSHILDNLKKYHKIRVILTDDIKISNVIAAGVKKFCRQNAIRFDKLNNNKDYKVNEGEIFITLREDDLVKLIEKTNNLGLSIGKQVGILSYNDTPLKRIVSQGITTISLDFIRLSELIGQQIPEISNSYLDLPFYVTMRKSL